MSNNREIRKAVDKAFSAQETSGKPITAPSLSRRVFELLIALVGGGLALFLAMATVLPSTGAAPWVYVGAALLWLLWVITALAALGMGPSLLRLLRGGIPFGAAFQIASNWGVHCEECGLYGEKRRGGRPEHVYPKLKHLETTPAGVTALAKLPGGGLTARKVITDGPEKLGASFGFPVTAEAVPGKPDLVQIGFLVRDPLEGVRHA